MVNTQKPKVYLDNCCFNRPYDDQSEPRVNLEACAKMLVQDMIRDEKVLLTTSTVLDFEISKCPYEDRKVAITSFMKKFSGDYVEVNAADDIVSEAEAIISTGVKFYDAYHVACAIHAGCDYFLSTDKRLLKYQTDKVRIINPIDFIREMEEENE